MTKPRVGLIGVSGYSRVHLDHLLPMHARGDIEFAAALVINRNDEPDACRRLEACGCRVFGAWDAFMQGVAQAPLDLCIVPTPINLHASMSIALLRAGVHVLVEKPLTATVGEARQVAAVARKTGLVAAVGFQYLHAAEVQELKGRLVDGAIGPIRRIAVHAAWPRSHGYYARNDWAGRVRTPDGWVLDSPVANAMAHFFMLQLYFSGGTFRGCARVRNLTAELYRAQPIETFDTAALRLTTESGCVLEFFGTHSSREIARPTLIIEGERGTAEWVQDRHAQIKGDRTAWHHPARSEPETRERMLYDVLGRIQGQDRFVCLPEDATEHVRCVNALHEHGRIVTVAPEHVEQDTAGGETFTCIRNVDALLARALRERSDLRRAGAPWATDAVRIPMEQYAGIQG